MRYLRLAFVSLVAAMGCGEIEDPVSPGLSEPVSLPETFTGRAVAIRTGESPFIQSLYDVSGPITLFESANGQLEGGMVTFADPSEAGARHRSAQLSLLGENGVSPGMSPESETLRAYETRIYRETLESSDLLIFFVVRNHVVVYAYTPGETLTYNQAATRALTYASDLFVANDLIGTFPIGLPHDNSAVLRVDGVTPSPYKRLSAGQPLDVHLDLSYDLPFHDSVEVTFSVYRHSDQLDRRRRVARETYVMQQGSRTFAIDLRTELSEAAPGDVYRVDALYTISNGNSGRISGGTLVAYRIAD